MGSNAVKKSPPSRTSQKARSDKSDLDYESGAGLLQESVGLLLIVFGIFLAAALASYLGLHDSLQVESTSSAVRSTNLMGAVGALSAELLFALLGWCAFVIAVLPIILGRTIWVYGWPEKSSSFFSFISSLTGAIGMAAACATMASILGGYNGGGAVGSFIAFHLVRYVNEPGTVLLSFATFMLCVGLATGIGSSALLGVVSGLIRFLQLIVTDTWHLTKALFRSLGAGNFIIVKVFVLAGFFVFTVSKRIALGILQLPVLTFHAFRLGFTRFKIARNHRRAGAPVGFIEDQGDTDRPFVFEADNSDSDEDYEDEEPEEETRQRLRITRRKKLKRKQSLLKQKAEAFRAKKKVNGKTSGKKADQKLDFALPPLKLLTAGDEKDSPKVDDKLLLQNSKRLENTLADFRVGGKVTEVHPGPVITLYQFEPAAGVKAQRVINLADDLALALRVSSVRVYAPVPGKGAVGIEVPNQERDLVRLRDILDTPEFAHSDSGLSIALGKDTFGDPYVTDLSKMPHLLIAGATGTGKSVGINAILVSLLYRNSPEDLRFIMIDPKLLELSIYEDIPHLKAPVVTNAKRARGVLWWAVEEMERRYRLMKDLGVRNFANYNRLVEGGEEATEDDQPFDQITSTLESAPVELNGTGENIAPDRLKAQVKAKTLEKLPRIVIVVDELADLMLSVGREIEELLTRLAQKARAAGIHLILATQRPSVNVITGLIKANFPARISFRVASKIDARTVMDTSGAEKLLGHGDMLFLAPGAGRPKRLHSAFISDTEVQEVVSWLRSQGRPDYDKEIESMIERLEESENSASGSTEHGDAEYDPLYDQAVAYVVEKGHASTSMVQRVFRIGYNRAARMLEVMEREGVVGAADGAKPRQVLLPNREHL